MGPSGPSLPPASSPGCWIVAPSCRPITLEDHANARPICEPLKLLDYCLINDGAVAWIMTSAERAKDMKRPPVLLSGYARQDAFHYGSGPADDFWYPNLSATRSVYDRVKSPYPSTQDPKYHTALQANVKDLLAKPSHQVFDLVSREWMEQAVKVETPLITQASRRGLERALDLALWIDMYAPTLTLS